jgi:hypothetical protein
MKEIWKILPFDSNYAVSSFGRVKSLPRIVNAKNGKKVPFSKPNLILKSRIVGVGPQIAIGKGKNRKEYKIDYLVYITFKSLIPENLFIVHKDGNILNNNKNNLILKTVFQIHKVREKFFVPITDYPSYVINKKGIVLNIKTSDKVAWTYSIANKCIAIRLWKNNTTKLFYLYRLVALHFIPNPYNKPYINHKDGNRMNLSLYNLEWVTANENMKHAVKTGLAKGLFETGINNRTRHLNKQII